MSERVRLSAHGRFALGQHLAGVFMLVFSMPSLAYRVRTSDRGLSVGARSGFISPVGQRGHTDAAELG